MERETKSSPALSHTRTLSADNFVFDATSLLARGGDGSLNESQQPVPNASTTPESEEQHPPKRPKGRRRYTPATKQAVIKASERGVRAAYLEVAASLGMNLKTADNLVSMKRTGREMSRAADRQPGATKKLKDEDQLNLADLLHNNCLFTLEQLRARVNREKLRRIMQQLEDQIEQKHKLQQQERVRFKELDQDRCLRIAAVKEQYTRVAIRHRDTIAKALKDMVYTTKNVVYEKTTMNSAEAKRKRLAFCKWLQPILGDDDNNHVIFIDEMPFYITRSRTRGRAPKGARAVSTVAPLSPYALKTTVIMAVDERHGLVKGEIFPPQTEQVGGRQILRPHYRHTEFKAFLDRLLALLWQKRLDFRLQAQDTNKGWRRKNIYILIDGAPEHGKQAYAKQLIVGLQSSRKWKEWLGSSGPALKLVFLPANSPVLNLCEFFNRTLRTMANVKRNEPEFLGKLTDTTIPHGEKQLHRLFVLKDIISASMAEMQRKGPQMGMVTECRKQIERAIEKEGFIDMTIPN